MDTYSINDIRTDFKNITFSKYQKSKAKTELINSIYYNKIENACYWSAEFICAGHYLDLWDIIILYITKYIHHGNPKLSIYIAMRYNNFTSIIQNGYSNNILVLRNNNKIRKLFAEIICVLSYSTKKHIYQTVKLNKNTEFDLTSMSDKFNAPNINYVDNILKDDDPKELIIPINELVYNLSIKNIIDTYYWLEWVLEYENICIKKKKKCLCQARTYAPNNFHNDIIWIIWDILFYYSNPDTSNISNGLNKDNKDNKNIIYKIIKSLFTLFTIKYKPCCKRKRKYILYFAFSLLVEITNFNIPIIGDNLDVKINAILEKIDIIYKDIKKNEVSPNTDYLFSNLKKSNMEKTIEKIELINNL